MTAENSTLTISIVNHRNREQTLALLDGLADLPQRPDIGTVVLDNASEDGSAKAISTAHPSVRVIARSSRAGFGANHNLVIQQTDSKYVLLLNDDAMIDAASVDELVDYLGAHEKVAAAGPRIVSPTGRQLQTAWGPFGPARAALFAATAGQLGWIQSKGKSPRAVGRLSGCALILRRSALPVPAFDEGFFMYAEDSDLCMRLRSAGHEVHFVPSAVVTHHGRQSTAAVPERRRVEQARSTHRFLAKHYGPLTSAFIRGALALGYLEKAVARSLLSLLMRRKVFGAASGEFTNAAKDVLRSPAGPGLRELAEDYNARGGGTATEVALAMPSAITGELN
jgi:N-acetylglucosaminyl-diphospho-decaprenol L-rhamnosyltransferase